MPATAPQRQERYATAISLPRHLADHVAAQASARGVSSADYIRLLIFRDIEAGKQEPSPAAA
jgi:hypothetical protein